MDKKRIIIIDDETDFTDLVRMGLERRGGYEVRTLNDPRLALTEIREFMPDLILLDIVMPNIDGTELAGMIKEDPKLKDIPIVFLTATVTRNETESEAGIIGGRVFIAKPVDIRDLMSTIDKYIKR